MKRFSISILSFLLPVILVIISVNYFGDAANIYQSEYEERISQALVDGNKVTGISNFNERRLAEQLVQGYSRDVNCIVLGSSRTMLVGESMFEDSTALLNLSVSGAKIEDILAIYNMLQKRNEHFDLGSTKIILGLDPWMFNASYPDTRWMAYGEEFFNFVKEPVEGKVLTSLSELVSLSYFQSSWPKLIAKVRGRFKVELTEQSINEMKTKLPDGSIVYGSEYRERSADVVLKEIFSSRTEGKLSYGLTKPIHLREETFEYLNLLIGNLKEAQGKNLNLELILTPYHPDEYDFIEAESRFVSQLEERLLSWKDSAQVELKGSFNYHRLDAKGLDFYDGIHCKEPVIRKILFKDNNY